METETEETKQQIEAEKEKQRKTVESLPESNEIGNLIEEVVNFYRQINSEADSDDVQEQLNFYKQELTINKFLEMQE
ncbi:hypothetical protein TNCV_1943411 [Trichonephila clavipes]|nr:hypothetical protein TNCV_1943411 [Trichonephila clavipes]